MERENLVTADGFTYVNQAVDIVEKIYDYITPTTAIDIGAGSGRNARLLAERGCRVTCVESGPESLALLRALRDDGHDVHVTESRLQDLTATKQYGAVLCNMVLHFLSPDEIVHAVGTIKDLTAKNGVVSISAYIDCRENASLPKNYTFKFAHGQLLQMFFDWEILFYTEDYPLKHKKVAVNDGRGYISARLIARKRRD